MTPNRMLKKASSRGTRCSGCPLLFVMQWANATGRSHRSEAQRFLGTRCSPGCNGLTPPRLLRPCHGKARVSARVGLGGCEKAFLNILYGIRSGSRFLVSPGFTEWGKGFSTAC